MHKDSVIKKKINKIIIITIVINNKIYFLKFVWPTAYVEHILFILRYSICCKEQSLFMGRGPVQNRGDKDLSAQDLRGVKF